MSTMTPTALPRPAIVGTSSWRGKALVPVLVYVGLLVALVSSLGAPLIPVIATDYHVSLGEAQWSLTLALLVGAVSSPVIGRLGDGPRRLRVLQGGLAAMVVGSVCAALPLHVFVLFLIGRGLQGCGLALLPLAMSVARDHMDPERGRSTLATLSVTGTVGVGLGYPLTGVIAQHFSFHMAFWLAAVLGVIALGASALVVPSSGHRPRQRFDLIGALLLGPAVAGLLIVISEGGVWGWGSPAVLVTLVCSLAVLGAWIWHELRTAEPLIDLRLMRHGAVATANVTGFLAGVGMYMLLSMIIRYVQTPTSTSYGLGASVVVAGLVLLPWSIASFLSSRLVNYALTRIGTDRILPFSAVLFAISLILFATMRDQLWEIFVEMGVGGLGIGCLFAVMPRMILSAVPGGQTGSALALNQVVRSIGFSIGSALAATILTAHTAAHAELPANAGYTVGAVVGIGLCVLTAVVSWGLSAKSARTARTVLNRDQALLVEQNVDAAIAGLLTLEDDDLSS